MENKDILDIIVIVSAFLASGFWFASGVVRIKYEPKTNDDGFTEASISRGGSDVFATLDRQSYLSAIAALLAGVSAVSQGIIVLCF